MSEVETITVPLFRRPYGRAGDLEVQINKDDLEFFRQHGIEITAVEEMPPPALACIWYRKPGLDEENPYVVFSRDESTESFHRLRRFLEEHVPRASFE